ncbi:hypothetical protein [Elongatibacter sediminis]|uniref:Uncharacterized protein n=1 Tax=Elongatibacter sediminis TaxID=3119006 RepID=A0AAW9RI85_9GAMM
MTDGPFKNLPLDRRSKRFAEAVQNEAVDQETRCAYANDAILNGILRENRKLVCALLQKFGQDGQLLLDPNALINDIFEDCPKSEFADRWQREVDLRLHEGEPALVAINSGLEAALETDINEFRTRIHEAGLEAQKERGMRKAQFEQLIEGCNRALEGVDRTRIIEALRAENNDAFKHDKRKRKGLDEGPKL